MSDATHLILSQRYSTTMAWYDTLQARYYTLTAWYKRFPVLANPNTNKQPLRIVQWKRLRLHTHAGQRNAKAFLLLHQLPCTKTFG